jgi:hypothetical protein
MVMELSHIYYQRFLDLLLDEYRQEFEYAKPGHCMKITGLALQELVLLRKMIIDEFPEMQVFILSENVNDTISITATKLIELRNELAAPLLILIPSNSKTSTEDSYGNATFKNLNISHFNRKLLSVLKTEIPVAHKGSLTEIFEYLKIQEIEPIQYIYFLLAIERDSYSLEAIGNALHYLSLIPDSKLVKEFAQIRQRLMFNLKCVEILGDFSRTISDRIAELPIEAKTIQTQIAQFFKAEAVLKNKTEICWKLAEDYPNLNFEHWPIPEINNKQEILVSLESISSKNFKEKDGDYTLTIVPGKTAKIILTISTNPAPKDFKELKYFRIVLWAIDGWSQVLEVKKAKVTEGPKNFRKVTVELSENVVEEGTYFFRVFAEDENGVILNTQDTFRNPLNEDLFKQQQEFTREEFQYRHQVKFISDTEDFYINIGQEDETEGESTQRKDKLDNALQAFFKYRIEQLRNNHEADCPQPINESGVFLKDFHNSLQGIYYLKYSSNHNYQINISKKLYDLENCFLKHANSLGRIEAVLGSNLTDTQYQSLQFIPFGANPLVPESLLKLRVRLFEVIQKSAPDSSGVFETCDLFNHIDLLRDYICAVEQWTRGLKNNLSNHSIENEKQQQEIRNALIELQNIDIATIQTKLPNGKDISVKLISPLHPLRLAWFLNLFDLFAEWETKSRENASYKWSKNLDRIFLGHIIPENGMLALADVFNSEYYQYSGELSFGWGLYTKSVQKEDDTFASNSRQIKIYLSTLLNISNEYRIDTDINQVLIVRHLKNYVAQHPYTETLVINLFNVGDAYVFSNALIELEKQSEFKKLRYELRLFSEDDVIQPGEALKYLLNPESNIISEEAEAFSQPSKNRLFPKLRFSINKVSDFINHAKEYGAHISFLINPFPVKTTLVRPATNRKSFYFHSLVNRQIVSVSERGNNISWNKYYSENHGQENDTFANITIDLFANIQTLVSNAIAVGETQSVPATNLELKEQDKFLLSFIHDVSDWVITFDKNMGPEIFDLPGKSGEVPFLLDFIPGQELTGISSYLTTRPTSEIIGLLGPHFIPFGIDLRKNEDKLRILLEDLRTVSSSLILQLNSSENKAFEVLGTAFTKRVLDKKGILENAFLIPIDLHKDLFEQLPGENKKRADNLLVNIDNETRTINFSVIEIKCRASIGESEHYHLVEMMQAQITNTIEALRFHFDITYQNPDRLDRELKTIELKSFLEFYINRATRYNQLLPQTQQVYLDFLECLNDGYDIQFKKLGIIYNFSQEKPQLKEVFDDNTTFFTFGNSVISDILDPDSDLNTSRLEGQKDDIEFQSFFDKRKISPYVENILSGGDIVADPAETYITSVNKVDSEENKHEDKNPITHIHSEEQEESFATTPSVSQTDSIPPTYDILVGKSTESGQYGILGKVSANKKTVALDLSETNTISLFGVQGAGKSYTIGTISEMVLKQFDKVNYLPGALAGVIFHYSESLDYAPEFTSMIHKNDKQSELQKLKNEYGAEPSSVEDVVLLTPRDKVEERKREYPSVNVYPISFNSSELNVQDWMFLLGAVGNDSTYIKQLKSIMRSMRTNITLEGLRNSVVNSSLLSNSQKILAEQRIQFASEYIDDNFKLCDLLKSGRLIIVDLRDEFIEKDEALGLFVVMLNIFSSKKAIDNQSFNKFIVFDEAHKYMDNKDLTRSIVTAIREMRHKGVSIMIASQDPPSLPNEIIELSSVVLLHKFNSPQWLKHIQKSVAQLASLTPADLSSLSPGEAFLWATKSTDKPLTNRPVKISTRPRVTKHGGETIKAI